MKVKEKKQSYFLVIGLGASGVSMARFLHSKGETVIATDIDDTRSDIAEELNALGIKTEIGFHHQDTFNGAGTLVPSPGIALTNSYIRTAIQNGVTLTGELDIFFQYNTLPVIAITGTNGKTTTTTLIGDMLTASGMKAFVGGNIGTPLVDYLMNEETADIIVAEVSSFQLDLSKTFKPDVGVLLNISEDHLDRYENFAAYTASKWSLFKNQGASDAAIINSSIKEFDTELKKIDSKIFSFSSEKGIKSDGNAQIDLETIQIKTEKVSHTIQTAHLKELQGAHNRENIAAAVLSCLAAGADINGIIKGLETFKNLSHRMEFVKTIQGISFYDDSKATNTDAVIRAIECFEKNIILILGGREKGTHFSQLIKDVKKSVKTIIAIGESTAHIKKTFDTICPVICALTMKEAVKSAFETAAPDDTVLLSPACASFDMYKNYAHRGNDFITQVNALEEEYDA